jgi:hypothetical protein
MTPENKVVRVVEPNAGSRFLAFRVANATGGSLRLYIGGTPKATLAPAASAGLSQSCPANGCFHIRIDADRDSQLAVNVFVIPGLDGEAHLDLDGQDELLGLPFVVAQESRESFWPLGTTGRETFGATVDYCLTPDLEGGQPQPEATLELPDGTTRALGFCWVDGTSLREPATLTITDGGAVLSGLDSFRCE